MADLYIQGDIVSAEMSWVYDFFGLACVSPIMVRDAISNLETDDILTVHINSYGGDVSAGQEIYTVLSQIRDRVIVQVESVACSAASMIAMAGGHVSMSPVALLMIHRSWATTTGNMVQMQHDAGVLATVDGAIAAAYAAKTGMAQEEILDMMDRETWLTAADALEKGFVDEVTNYSVTAPVQAAAAFGNLSVTPAMIAEAQRARAKKEAEEAARAEILAGLDDFGV